jgi:hypothetical protein
MTRKEALHWLHKVKWALVDADQTWCAQHVEEVESRIRMPFGLKHEELRSYSEFWIAPGKRGRLTLVLHRPYEARVIAWLVGMLRSIED